MLNLLGVIYYESRKQNIQSETTKKVYLSPVLMYGNIMYAI